jgi:peptidyl-prolyl cis-trans isomerase C
VRRSSLVVAVLLLAAAACAPEGERSAPERGGGAVLATYDGGTFTTEDFRRAVERVPPAMRARLAEPERRRDFVDSQILNELLAAEGRRRGYDRDPDIVRQIEDLRKRLIVQRIVQDIQEAPAVSDEEIAAYYERNKRLFSGTQVRAAHILVKDEALARSLHEQLRADPDRFEELARAHSTDTATAARGGDLGFFGQGRMVPAFERAAFALEEPGDVSDVVRTAFGYHVVKLLERRDAPDKPLEEVRDRIRVALIGERRQSQVSAHQDELRAKANVRIDDEALARVEIPQGAPGTGGLGGTGSH